MDNSINPIQHKVSNTNSRMEARKQSLTTMRKLQVEHDINKTN